MCDEKILKHLILAAEAHRVELSEAQQYFYLQEFKKYQDENLEKIFNWIITQCKFFPKICEIREMISGTPDDRALYAWNDFLHALRHVGTHKSVVFADPVIHTVIKTLFGSWSRAGETKETDLPFLEKRFIAEYKALKKTSCSHPAYLPGRSEQKNVRNGFPADKPVLVGNSKNINALPLSDQTLEFEDLMTEIHRRSSKNEHAALSENEA